MNIDSVAYIYVAMNVFLVQSKFKLKCLRVLFTCDIVWYIVIYILHHSQVSVNS